MQYQFPLVARREIAEQTMEFALSLAGQQFPFKAGQHADFQLESPLYTDEKGSKRIFSYVSSPNDSNELRIATRMSGSAFKRSLEEMPLGGLVTVSDNRGQMVLPRDPSRPVVFLAGGIGITPFMSMSRYACEEQLPHQIYLLYANKSQATAAYLPELRELATQNPRFKLIEVYSEPLEAEGAFEIGRISSETIKKYLENPQEAFFFMAGPPAMVQSLTGALDELDVPEEYRKSEDFSGYESVSALG